MRCLGLFLLLLYSLLSCTDKNITISHDLDPSKIAVYGRLSAGHNISHLWVSRSVDDVMSRQTLKDLLLTDARVVLFKNGVFREQLRFKDETTGFTSVDTIEGGHVYHIEVAHPDYPSAASAPVLVPSALEHSYAITKVDHDVSAPCYSGRLHNRYHINIHLALDDKSSPYIEFSGVSTHRVCELELKRKDCDLVDIGRIIKHECLDNAALGVVFTYLTTGDQFTYFNINNVSQEYFSNRKSSDLTSAIESGLVSSSETFSNIEGGYGLLYGVSEVKLYVDLTK